MIRTHIALFCLFALLSLQSIIHAGKSAWLDDYDVNEIATGFFGSARKNRSLNKKPLTISRESFPCGRHGPPRLTGHPPSYPPALTWENASLFCHPWQ